MSKRTTFIIIGVILVLVLVIIFFPRSGNQNPTNGNPVSKVIQTPKVESQLPSVPQNVSLESIIQKSLPKTLPSYRTSTPALIPLTSTQVQSIANDFSFDSAGEKRTGYGGGNSYIFEDSLGRVLSITDDPPTVDFSELPNKSAGKIPPTLEAAKTLSLNLINAVQPNLPTGWEIKVVNSVYLKGGGSSASEVATPEEASMTNVSLGYIYSGYPVLNNNGKLVFFNFVFGPGGSVISAKAHFLLNNLNLQTEKSANVSVKNMEEVNASFFNGEAKAISLGLSSVVSDEPIINPPTSVVASDMQSVLVLSGSRLLPYYLISSQGALPSSRAANVIYLVSASR